MDKVNEETKGRTLKECNQNGSDQNYFSEPGTEFISLISWKVHDDSYAEFINYLQCFLTISQHHVIWNLLKMHVSLRIHKSYIY